MTEWFRLSTVAYIACKRVFVASRLVHPYGTALPQAVTDLLDASSRLLQLIREKHATAEEECALRAALATAFTATADGEEVADEWEAFG